MRRCVWRREAENRVGYQAAAGTFAQLISDAAAVGSKADRIRGLLAELRIRPSLRRTPTEAKRVTVLERSSPHLPRLMDSESPRWTARERAELVHKLGSEIELLWLTGELRPGEAHRGTGGGMGTAFLQRNPVRRRPPIAREAGNRAKQSYPGVNGSKCGILPVRRVDGRRPDGNPSSPTRLRGKRSRPTVAASLARYRARVAGLIRTLSIAEAPCACRPDCGIVLAQLLTEVEDPAASPHANRGELFQTIFACMLAKIDATLDPAGARRFRIARICRCR